MKLSTLAAAMLVAMLPSAVSAADLGKGGCCADLDERLAELEATAARKTTRKTTLVIYGQINQSLLWTDLDGSSRTTVGNSGVDTSLFGMRGESRFGSDSKAGFALELGLDNGHYVKDADIAVRESNVWLSTVVGKMTLGRARQATQAIAEISLVNTTVAAKMLHFGPLPSVVVGDAPAFGGSRLDLLRYDTPDIGGVIASASVANDHNWDVAVRFARQAFGFKIAAGVGYRGQDVSDVASLVFLTRRSSVVSGSISLVHEASGLFVNTAYGQIGVPTILGSDVKGTHVQAGIERNWTGSGTTTLFVEAARYAFGGDAQDMIGMGVVQNLNGTLDLYLSGRQYQNEGPRTIMFGARLRF